MKPEVPRDQIDWSPRINYDACLGDHMCFDFCHNDVFTWDEENNRPIVANPNNCVLGCDSCAQICTVEAISFPSKDELRATLKRLRAEMQAQGQTSVSSNQPVEQSPNRG
jgi:NAD-dependent dihydropyrimidine dehydrogenase PreA subunit